MNIYIFFVIVVVNGFLNPFLPIFYFRQKLEIKHFMYEPTSIFFLVFFYVNKDEFFHLFIGKFYSFFQDLKKIIIKNKSLTEENFAR